MPLEPESIKNTEKMQEMAAAWTRSQPAVATFINAMVPNFHQAEDILQTVSVVIVEKYHLYDTSRSFTAWATGIARFEVLKSRRSYTRDKHQFTTDLISQLIDSVERQENKMSEMRHDLRDCIRQLQGRARKTLDLRYSHDMKPPQIAKELDVTPNVVSVLLHRVRTTLKKCIEKKVNRDGKVQ